MTARGKPSGTATTTIVTPTIKNCRTLKADYQVRKAAVPDHIVEIISLITNAAKVIKAT